MTLKSLTVSVVAATASLVASAQALTPPKLIPALPGQSYIVQKISDNGRWMVTESTVEDTEVGGVYSVGGTLVDLETPTVTYAISHPSNLCEVADVSDDGNIIVGSAGRKPAFLNRTTGQWTQFTPPTYTYPNRVMGDLTGETITAQANMGSLRAVTPDGHYAIGLAIYDETGMIFQPLMYDLTTGQLVEIPNLPSIDMEGQDMGQNWFLDISADGRYIFGQLSYSYMMPIQITSYVYDRQTDTVDFIGFDVQNYNQAGTVWTPRTTGVMFINDGVLSSNGKWLTGAAYVGKEQAGSDFYNEYRAAYLYNTETKQFTLYDGQFDNDFGGFTVTNDGVVYAANPAENPYTNAFIRHGNYFYSVSDILQQVYGITPTQLLGSDNTGKPVDLSADAKVLALITSPYDTRLLRMETPLHELCAQVDMLGSYTVSPTQGATLSSISELDITFLKNVDVIGDPTQIQILDADGSPVRNALRAQAEKSRVRIGFRTTQLEKGKTYTVRIPAGMFCLSGDRAMASKEITVTYKGRGNEPVKFVSANPAAGTSLAMFDLNASPLILTFDADVTVAEGAMGSLNRLGEDGGVVCSLNLAANSLADRMNTILVYPTAGQYLYKDVKYQVVIPAGAITDLSGNGPNAEIVLEYDGTYVRQVSTDERYIFNETCDSFNNWLFYEGDNNTPTDEMVAWGFLNGQQYPYFIVYDENDTSDGFFASHSMYNPAGKSNDWASTPQLFIPDGNCVLTFDAQRYRSDKADRLKVIVLEKEDIYNQLTENIVSVFEKDGKVVFDEVLPVGATEEGALGEWSHKSVSLSEYAGKHVYIAFVNQNDDQSAFFLDNVRVSRDIDYLLTIESPSRVVDKSEQIIKGNLTVATELATYNSIDLTLKTAYGEVVDKVSATGLNLKKDGVFSFSFAKPLPLRVGIENTYYIVATINGGPTKSHELKIADLVFEPIQRVVLEEFTGSDCANCPLGINAMENLERLYGEQFIPITLRNYGSDFLGAGSTAYASFLGFSAAPTGRVNRLRVNSPMVSNGTNYYFSINSLTPAELAQLGAGDNNLWADDVAAEFAKGTDFDVDFVPTVEGNSLSLKCFVRAAVAKSSQSLGLFAVVTEDDLETYQMNNVYSFSDPNLGEYGAGGIYAQATIYPWYANDVTRTTLGNTFNGSIGLLPAQFTGGQTVEATLSGELANVTDQQKTNVTVMVIDQNTGKILNARRRTIFDQSSGLGNVAVGGSEASVRVVPGAVAVNSSGKFTVQVYNMAGVLLASGEGENQLTLHVRAQGPAVVRVQGEAGQTIVKTLLK